jgi:hypothetical protein
MHERARELQYEECMAIVNGQQEEDATEGAVVKKRRYTKKK